MSGNFQIHQPPLTNMVVSDSFVDGTLTFAALVYEATQIAGPIG